MAQQAEHVQQLQTWSKKYELYQDSKGVWRRGKATVVANPEDHKRDIIKHYHNLHTAGHPGIYKTLFALATDFWWPGLRKDVTEYVTGCAMCQATKAITHRNLPATFPITPEYLEPFGTIAMDFIMKLPESHGSNAILTITDHNCTKAVLLLLCREDATIEHMVETYYQQAFPYIRIPHKVISD